MVVDSCLQSLFVVKKNNFCPSESLGKMIPLFDFCAFSTGFTPSTGIRFPAEVESTQSDDVGKE